MSRSISAIACIEVWPLPGSAKAPHPQWPEPTRAKAVRGDVTAASAPWQINGEPVFYAGDFYYAAGPTVFFDGNVMVRSGSYRGVPLYADSTLQPYSVIFVRQRRQT